MASNAGTKPPTWFWVVSGILLLWGVAGCVALYGHIVYGPTMGETEWERQYFAALPDWFVWDYAVAVGGGVLGSVAMLARSRFAKLLYILSLIGVVIQFGYVFGATDLLAHKGAMATLFPAFIAAVALFQIWFSGLAAKRGWIS